MMALIYNDFAFLAQRIPGWTLNDNALEKSFIFSDFNEAFGFMARVALVSEQMGHHPEWTNIYNQVHIRLWTHTEGGVTDLDLDLAQRIDAIGFSAGNGRLS